MAGAVEAEIEISEPKWLEIEREASKRKLVDFLRLGWSQVDPGSTYLHNWHMDCLADHLQAAARGEVNRLLLNVPPGTSKSSITSVFFPAWLWGPFGLPTARIIGASHSQDLATRDNRKTRLLVESEWYQERWPVRIVSDQNAKGSFETQERGFRQSSAVAGITGKRGDFVIWDDPQKPEGANSEVSRETAIRIFQETLGNRLIDPARSVIIIIMQRLNEDDVSGHILAQELDYQHVMIPMEFEPDRRCYSVVKPTYMKSDQVEARYIGAKQTWIKEGEPVPAEVALIHERMPVQKVYNQDPRVADGELLFEKRFPESVVARDKKTMGSYAYAGQNQQRPAPREGAIFEPDRIKVIETKPTGYQWVRAWDLAATDSETAARTAGVLMGVSNDGVSICFADVTKLQGSPKQVQDRLLATAKIDGRGVRGDLPQDPGSAGKSWAMHLTATILRGFPYTYSTESGDKVTRALPLSAQIEAGNVSMLRGEWNSDFISELRSFPGGKFKDQVDAASRGYQNLIARPKAAMSGRQS